MRLIDADALKKEILKKRGLSWESMQHIFCITAEELDNAPTVEPEKVLIANVTFDTEKLKEFTDEIVESIKNGEIVLQDERPKGEWEKCVFISCGKLLKWKSNVIEQRCSKCGRWSLRWEESIQNEYCSHCGVKMRKGGAK